MKKLYCCFILFLLVQTMIASGQVWDTVGDLSFTKAYGGVCFAVAGNGTPYITYVEGTTGATNVRKFDGENWVGVGDSSLYKRLEGVTMAVDRNGIPYIAGNIKRSPAGVTIFKCLDGFWTVVGDSSFYPTSGTGGGGVSMVFDKGNAIYFAQHFYYYSAVPSSFLCKLVNGKWKVIAATLPDSSYYHSVAIDNNGTPFMAYGSNTDIVTVTKYDGTTRLQVVGSKLDTHRADEQQSIALNNSGVPYIAYMNAVNVSVMKYSMSNDWEPVGDSAFVGRGYSPTMAIDNNDVPCVAYISNNSFGAITVLKFSGKHWDTLGNFDVKTRYAQIAIDSNNRIYIAFADSSSGYNIRVLRYGPPVVEKPGAEQKITIMPNPAAKELLITSDISIRDVLVTNAAGHLIFSREYNSQRVLIDIADWTRGMYYIKTNGSNIQKFIKN